MEAADDHATPRRAELPADIERARKLVGLHADQDDHAAAGSRDLPRDPALRDQRVAFVPGSTVMSTLARARAARPRPARSRRRSPACWTGSTPPPLDHVAVVVIVRRLDYLDME